MRTGELECIHGVGHSAGVHGCDGCCTPLVHKAKAEAWEEGWKTSVDFYENPYDPYDNPYRQRETE